MSGKRPPSSRFIISQLFHPIVWLVWQTCSDKAEFLFLQRKTGFCIGAPLNEYQTDVWFVRYIRVRSLWMDGINRVGPLLPQYTILRFRENTRQCLKRLLSNFNIVANPNIFVGSVTPRMYETTAKPAGDTSVHRIVQYPPSLPIW